MGWLFGFKHQFVINDSGDSINYPAMAKMDASFSAYNSRSFNRDHLVKKAVDAIIDDVLPMPRGTEFLPQLIREGKKYYISDKLLPYVSDTVIWEYSTEQWKWVQENEWNIYSFLVSNELFYSTNRAKYIRLITAAPSTPDMPPEAPGRSVIYIAYKIVERYAERNPSMSLQEIIDTDANTIFQGAKYKPERWNGTTSCVTISIFRIGLSYVEAELSNLFSFIQFLTSYINAGNFAKNRYIFVRPSTHVQ